MHCMLLCVLYVAMCVVAMHCRLGNLNNGQDGADNCFLIWNISTNISIVQLQSKPLLNPRNEFEPMQCSRRSILIFALFDVYWPTALRRRPCASAATRATGPPAGANMAVNADSPPRGMTA